ncbi:hypothetical protein [Pseudomonas bohemica]|uniref:hypothetical protein n=1 Tax=Pseudomonas bohemica TaxID=2044872 RepID=UPI000DA618FD|nr:hypothetical protein [Pseudomonas bohemica]
MYAGRELALHIALKAILMAAKKRGIDVDELTDEAAQILVVNPAYGSWGVSQAIFEIEKAVDALVVE